MIVKHADENKTAIQPSFFTDGFIEHQPEWEFVKFGTESVLLEKCAQIFSGIGGNVIPTISNMALSGCEIIATYNALYALGEPVNIETMVVVN